jgi:hypothetical protein
MEPAIVGTLQRLQILAAFRVLNEETQPLAFVIVVFVRTLRLRPHLQSGSVSRLLSDAASIAERTLGKPQ